MLVRVIVVVALPACQLVFPLDATPRPAADATAPVETLAIPSNGDVITTGTILEAGRRYLLVASGTYQIALSEPPPLGDAEYIFVDTNPQDGEGPGFFDSGISINHPVGENKMTRWGSFQDSHRYELMFEGLGASLTVQLLDQDPENNAGALTFEIYD